MIKKNKKFIDPRYFMDEKMEINENEAAMLRRLSRDNPLEDSEPALPPTDDPAVIELAALKDRTYENLDNYADFWSWADDEHRTAFDDIVPHEGGMNMEKLKEKLVAFVVNNAYIDEDTARTEIVR